MPPRNSTSGARRTWLIIFSALVLSIGIYGLLCLLISRGPAPHLPLPGLASMRVLVTPLAIGSLVASMAWLRFHVDGKIGGEGREVRLSASEFQTQSIVALALSEACTILGLLLFFLGAPITEFARFAAGTLLVDFAFILPRGLQFWSTQK